MLLTVEILTSHYLDPSLVVDQSSDYQTNQPSRISAKTVQFLIHPKSNQCRYQSQCRSQSQNQKPCTFAPVARNHSKRSWYGKITSIIFTNDNTSGLVRVQDVTQSSLKRSFSKTITTIHTAAPIVNTQQRFNDRCHPNEHGHVALISVKACSTAGMTDALTLRVTLRS
jgi:hypothetical protein